MLSACTERKADAASPTASPAADAQQLGWPRTIRSEHGDITLTAQPRRIVSTSVTLTGTLLAIEAPLIGSSATRAADVTDTRGFFTQWTGIATQRGVRPIYDGEPNAEAVAAANPDLIVVAATGGDSALKIVEQLRQIAPTVVVNYDDKSWQELALVLGQVTGREAAAAALNERFSRQLNETRKRLHLPPQPTTAMVYYEDDSGANLWTADSAQGRVLRELGFELAAVPDAVKGDTSMGKRHDIVQVSGEKFAQALQGRTLLLFSANEKTVAQLERNRFLTNLPAVAQKRVYAVGVDTFRLDYYSASNLLQRLERLFGEKNATKKAGSVAATHAG
jgi:ABC-type Fe2+-enterobactin transport system substrate-binding protein